MGVLIITLIAGALYYCNIITATIFTVAVLVSLVWTYVGAGLYFLFGFFKFFYHDFLWWHTPDDSPQWSDGCSEHATCKYCGKDIMRDSQGNWF